MKYDLVSRSPFVEHDWTVQSSGVYESTYKCSSCGKAVTDSTEGTDGRNTAEACATIPDMSDWRNWKSGDIIMLRDHVSDGVLLKRGQQYSIVATDPTGFWISGGKAQGLAISDRVDDFRFHARPVAS